MQRLRQTLISLCCAMVALVGATLSPAAAWAAPGPAPSAAAVGPGPFAKGTVVSLQGTPHLWFADEWGTLHWGGDTRALAGHDINWNSRVSVSLDQLRTLPRGGPWLSAGLLKLGEPIYFVKWETGESAPTLLHIQSISDVQLFGIDSSNYGTFVLEQAAWEQRFGFRADRLAKAELATAASSTSAAEAWQEFAPLGANFLVLLPAANTPLPIESATEDTPLGPITFHLYGFGAVRSGSPFGYLVGYLELPEGAVAEVQAAGGIDALFAEVQQGMVSGRSTVRTVDPIMMGVYAGREVTLDVATTQPSVMTERMYLVKQRLYVEMIIRSPDQGSSPEVARFLNSFKLLPF